MKIIDENNYADKAEQVITKLSKKTNKNPGKPVPIVTTSKIRNLLAMTSDIYNEVLVLQDDTLGDEVAGRIQYLRIRFVYESGREPAVKTLVREAQILEILSEIGNSRKNYILFSRYMESLVAFRKYLGGKDD